MGPCRAGACKGAIAARSRLKGRGDGHSMSESLPTTYRSTLVGTLGLEDVGSEVRLVGWVHRRRDLGGLVFVDLRDRSGKVQLSFGPGWSPAAVLDTARTLSQEDVIQVRGTVVARPEANVNKD